MHPLKSCTNGASSHTEWFQDAIQAGRRTPPWSAPEMTPKIAPKMAPNPKVAGSSPGESTPNNNNSWALLIKILHISMW